MKNFCFKLKILLIIIFFISISMSYFLKSNAQAGTEKAGIIKTFFDEGRQFEDEGKYDQAIEVYTKTIEMSPELAEAYFNRGLVYKKKNEFDNAMADYNKAVERKPDFAMAYNNIGNIFNKKQEFEKAIKNYSKAVNLDKNYALAYFNRCTVWEQKGDIKRAIKDIKSALKLKPDDKVFIEGLKYLETRLEEKPAVDNTREKSDIRYLVLKNINIRSGPSVKYKKTGEIYKGVSVSVEKIEGDWAKLGESSWVYAKLLRAEQYSDFEIDRRNNSNIYNSEGNTLSGAGSFFAKVNINVRRGPSTSFMRVGKLIKGARIDVIEIAAGWAKIGKEKWVLAKLLDDTDQYRLNNQTTEVVQSDAVTIPLVFVKEELSTQENRGRYFADKNINIRSGSSLDFPKIGLLKAGSPVYVVENINGWAKIGEKNWVYAQLLVKDSVREYSEDVLPKKTNGLFVIIKTAIVRLKPDHNSNNIGVLEKGLKVVVFEETGGWARIGEDKWISKKNIEIEESMPVKSDQLEYKNNLYIAYANLIIRSGPSTDQDIVASVVKGMYIDVEKIDNGWAKIGENKWIYAKYLKKYN